MGDEISRIDRLTEQLLDLASPRTYSAHPVELHAVLQTGFELIAGKAKEKSVQLIGEFEAKPDTVIGDPGAIKQVVLNLCLNAIQALEARTAGRWVRVSTRNVGGTIEMAVSDNGSGISPTMQSRLFQPFQSSKSSGFGLGLAICRDILTNLGATISIDPPQSGSGATFRVVFPCPPLLS
jgi:signal transduction histidine kinase